MSGRRSKAQRAADRLAGPSEDTLASPTIQVTQAPIENLRPDPANPRYISADELDALERSITEFGAVEPLVVRREDNTIIAGHQRFIVLRRLGFETVPVIFVDLSLEKARLLGLALNRIGGEFDEKLLAQLLADLAKSPNLDLSLSGFGEDEIKRLLGSLHAREKRERLEIFDLDEGIRGAYEKPRAQAGDLFALGEHRLMCADATSREEVAALMAGKVAALCLTDPPYGVNLGRHGGQGRSQRRRRLKNDDLGPEEWDKFCHGFVRIILEFTDGAIYCFMSSKELPTLSFVFATEGGHWSDYIVWDKGEFVLGRAPYQRIFELAWFGWREGITPYWCGSRRMSDLWRVERPTDSPLHPTAKPLALLEKAILNSSRPGDIVFDPFLGSGSTIIACERTGRICFGVELDPHYASLSLARWEAFSGLKAERVGRCWRTC